MKYFNTSDQTWDSTPYMEKVHTVYDGPYAATVVVVPMPKTKKNGDETTVFVPMGVRIEDTRSRVRHNNEYTLPGYTYFYKFKTNKVSETGTYKFHTDRLGNPFIWNNGPELVKPNVKVAGVPIEEHSMNAKLSNLVALARESYDAYRAEMRLANAA